MFLCVSRPAHDISLEEFDDEDLSEITDDCGIGLNYDSDPYEKVRPLNGLIFCRCVVVSKRSSQMRVRTSA